MSALTQKNLLVFISYSHRDQVSFDRLIVHLTPYTMRNFFSVWHDKQLKSGDLWRQEIQKGLAGSGAAVLLVSPDFMASEFIYNEELPILLKQASEKGLVIIPVILSASAFDSAKFKYHNSKNEPEEFSLADFQGANPLDKPLESLAEWQQDEVFKNLANRLLNIVNPTTNKDIQDMTGAITSIDHYINLQEVKDAVINSENDFRAASTQITIFTAYKKLHDLLHNLQYRCYYPIINASSRFPDDDSVTGDFMTYEVNLRSTIWGIQDIIRQNGNDQIDTQGLLTDIGVASNELSLALNSSNKKNLDNALFWLHTLFNLYPSNINTRLHIAANALRKSGLVAGMTIISEKIKALEQNPNRVSQFISGVDALFKIMINLEELVDEHNKWQTLDSKLRLIRLNADDFRDNLMMLWPYIKSLTDSIYEGCEDTWALDLKKHCQNLTTALEASSETNKLKNNFRVYRETAGSRFYLVDGNLRNLCTNLQLVGQALESLLRKLRGN